MFVEEVVKRAASSATKPQLSEAPLEDGSPPIFLIFFSPSNTIDRCFRLSCWDALNRIMQNRSKRWYWWPIFQLRMWATQFSGEWIAKFFFPSWPPWPWCPPTLLGLQWQCPAGMWTWTTGSPSPTWTTWTVRSPCPTGKKRSFPVSTTSHWLSSVRMGAQGTPWASVYVQDLFMGTGVKRGATYHSYKPCPIKQFVPSYHHVYSILECWLSFPLTQKQKTKKQKLKALYATNLKIV